MKRLNKVNRSLEMSETYQKHLADSTVIPDEDREVIREFLYWKIVENIFPYDAVYSTHHMLVPKRIFVNASDMNVEERKEYEEIIGILGAEQFYEAMMENFPKSRSRASHFHIHLFIWKRREEV